MTNFIEVVHSWNLGVGPSENRVTWGSTKFFPRKGG